VTRTHGYNALGENGPARQRAAPPMRMTASWFGADTALHRIQGCGADRRHPWQARFGPACVSSLDRPTPPDVGCRSAPAGRETKLLLRKKENDVKKTSLTKKAPYKVKRPALFFGSAS
jgi:hypothetical protein